MTKRLDINIGDKIGCYTILRSVENPKYVTYEVQCDCGAIYIRRGYTLRNHSRCNKCKTHILKNDRASKYGVGDIIGNWVILSIVGKDKNRNYLYKVKCKTCDSEYIRKSASLHRSNTCNYCKYATYDSWKNNRPTAEVIAKAFSKEICAKRSNTVLKQLKPNKSKRSGLPRNVYIAFGTKLQIRVQVDGIIHYRDLPNFMSYDDMENEVVNFKRELGINIETM